MLLVLLCGAAFAADDRFPVAGGYGFNWLQPEKTRCQRISAVDAASFGKCRYSKEFAFGLDMHAYSCKVDARTEYVILRTERQCREVFETMEANAP